MKTITAGGRHYTLYSLTGTVVKEKSLVKTTIFGHGGGSYSHNGYGFTVPVQITTSHLTWNQLFLVDGNGKEHAINLTDFDLHCREGQELIVIWAIRNGKEMGPCIAVKNQNTGKAYYDTCTLQKMFRPGAFITACIAILAFLAGQSGEDYFTGTMYGILAWTISGFSLRLIGNAQAGSFKSSFRFDV